MPISKEPATRTLAIRIPRPLEQLSKDELERKQHIGKVTTRTLRTLTEKFASRGFEWTLPVIFAKSTDPLWPDPGASIETRIETEIYGETVRTTLSMIIHKIVACSLLHPKFFTLSPNVRIEKRERRATGWHAYEFTQLDFEARNTESKDIRRIVEDILRGLLEDLKKNSREELTYFNRYKSLDAPSSPFKVYDREDLEAKYGKQWETQLPSAIKEPTWVTNIPREFYDYEDFDTRKWDNYDLFLPRYGEVLSGARREYEHGKITAKMERDGVKKENYELLLTLAKEGRVKPSAGAGIGVERLVSWIVGAEHIGEVQLFPKIPGVVYEL
ncbi:MAG: asparagine synthetase [Thaumarchaeota archaeon]|nr:asparagine synthetase [Nitrososphaerota archaeon]